MFDSICTANSCFAWLSANPPSGMAQIHGSDAFPDIEGQVLFYQRRDGVFVVAQITGLPMEQASCDASIFAMHIHSGGSCTGNAADPFADAGTHDNPKDCPHPSHAGDLPPLFGNDGYAWSAVFTNRFAVSDVIGKTVIIHRQPDDFTTQPAGNAGAKIACGVISNIQF